MKKNSFHFVNIYRRYEGLNEAIKRITSKIEIPISSEKKTKKNSRDTGPLFSCLEHVTKVTSDLKNSRLKSVPLVKECLI